MIKCPNCSREVSDDNIFCPDCGTRLSAPAPVQESQEPVAPAVAAEAPAEAAAQPAKKGFSFAAVLAALKKFWGKTKEVANKVLDKIPLPRKVVAIIGAALAVIIVAVIVLLIVLGANKDYPYALYVKDGDLYFSNLKVGKEVEIVDLSSDSNEAYYVGNSAALTKDGSRLFYPEFESDGNTLYYRDLKKKDSVKVDTNITRYAINEKGTAIVYIKEGNLYKSNLKDKEKIASEIGTFYISEDFKKIIYTKTSDGKTDLYFKNGNKDAEKMVSEASIVSYDHEKLAWIFYSKEGSLYFQKPGKDDKTKVADSYESFSTALEGGKAYFVQSTTSKTKLWDFVTDDLADADAAMTEPVAPVWPEYPDYPSSPWRSDYDTYEEYEAAYEEWEKEYNRMYEAYQAARDKYYEDQDKYYENMQVWYQKENRDELRQTLKETEYEKKTYELYYFNGKEAVLVASDLNGSWAFDYEYDEDGEAIAVGTVSVKPAGEMGKVKMSEISSRWDLENKLDSESEGEVSTKLVWQDKAFDLKVEDHYSIRFSENGKKVYILADVNEEKQTGDLYEAKFSKSGMGDPKKIDSDVSTSGFGYTADVGVYYMKDYKDGKGDLYVKGKKIDFDVKANGVAAFKGGYLYFSGEDMKYYKSGKAITVAEKVEGANLFNDDTLVLLYDWNEEKGKGTLGVFTGGKKVTVLDEDVTRLIYCYDSMIHSIYIY